MDAIRPSQARVAIDDGWRMRTGRKLGRTLYLYDPTAEPTPDGGFCIGIVDSTDLAIAIARTWNEKLDG